MFANWGTLIGTQGRIIKNFNTNCTLPFIYIHCSCFTEFGCSSREYEYENRNHCSYFRPTCGREFSVRDLHGKSSRLYHDPMRPLVSLRKMYTDELWACGNTVLSSVSTGSRHLYQVAGLSSGEHLPSM